MNFLFFFISCFIGYSISRHRSVTVPKKCNGNCTFDLSEMGACNTTGWSEWSGCNATCKANGISFLIIILFILSFFIRIFQFVDIFFENFCYSSGIIKNAQSKSQKSHQLGILEHIEAEIIKMCA